MTTRSPPWNEDENKALCALYFSMLDKALRPIKYNKAAMIRNIQAGNWDGHTEPLNRSKGSIEAKLMNATAAHRNIEPDATTMASHGYVPLPNMQAALLDAMRDALGARGNAQWSHRYQVNPVTGAA